MCFNNVEIYGIYRGKCQRLALNAQAAIATLKVRAKIVCQVESASQWRAYLPPLLLVNGFILSAGRVMTSEQIQQQLTQFPGLIIG